MDGEVAEVLGSPLEVLNNWLDNLVGVGVAPFVTAFIFLILTMLLSMVLSRGLRALFGRSGNIFPTASIFITIIRAAVWVLGLSVMFSVCFGIDMTAIVAALGIGGIALSLGLQDTISNLVGGINIGLSRMLSPGDFVEFEGKQGIVHDTNWRFTTINTFEGNAVAVPNAKINSSALVIFPSVKRIVVPINISKKIGDLDTTSEDIARGVEQALTPYGPIAQGPLVQFQSIDEFGYQGVVITWMDLEESEVDYLNLQNVVVHAVAPFAYPHPEER